MLNSTPAHWHILGAGAIGTLWGCHLSLCNPSPHLIVRRPEALPRFATTIKLSGQSGERAFQLQAELANSNTPIQRLMVTTKSYDTLEAIASIRHRLTSSSRILLLQNGMGQQQQLAEQLPEIALYAGTTTEGAYWQSPQHLIHAGRGESWIGPINRHAQQQGSEGLGSLQKMALKTGYDADILRRLWQKLAINAAINGLTAIHDCQNGALATNTEYRGQMLALCAEVEQLTSALQQPLFDQPLLDVALQVATATASNYSSMLQDVRHQRPTEIDFINGYICQQARRLGIDTPHNQALAAKIRNLHPF